jgi:hypothetical protein
MDTHEKSKKRLEYIAKLTKRILGAGTVILILAQFVRPDRSNPPVDPSLSLRSYPSIPPAVVERLAHSCFDCHSNETNWPWYSNLTPANFLVAHDVTTARRRMNFSEWRKHKSGRLQTFLEEIYDQVNHKEMPMKRYTLLHPEAQLSDNDIKMICDWASSEQDRLANADEADSLAHK